MPTRKIVHHDITNKLFDYMTRTDGKPMTADRIATDNGVPRQSVLNSMSYLVNHKPEMGVVRVKQAVYAYRPAKAEAVRTAIPRMYEEVGHYRDGSILVRNESGQLYTLTEL